VLFAAEIAFVAGEKTVVRLAGASVRQGAVTRGVDLVLGILTH